MMLPLHWIAGAAFAYQVAVLLTFVLAFGGTLALAGRFMGRLGATVVALLYTFWGFRWFQTLGHLNFLLGSACLPWMVWALERFLPKSSASIRVHTCTGAEARHRCKRPRPMLWLVFVGVAWAAAIAGSMYFIWIGSILLAGWLLGRRLGKQIDWRTAFRPVEISHYTHPPREFRKTHSKDRKTAEKSVNPRSAGTTGASEFFMAARGFNV